MKEINIVYFSGTGNTELISNEIKKRFQKTGYETKSYCIIRPEEIAKIDFTDKILGIGFPVYTFEYPQIINRILERLPSANVPLPAFIFTTIARNAGDTKEQVARRLLKKNYYTINMMDFICPSNGFAIMLKPSHLLYKKTVRFEKSIFPKIDRFTDEINANVLLFNEIPFYNLGKRNYLYKIERFLLTFLFENRMFKDLHVLNEKCVGCGLCAKLCVSKNIMIKNNKALVIHKNHCQRCTKCINICRQNAIQFGKKTHEHQKYDRNFIRQKLQEIGEEYGEL